MDDLACPICLEAIAPEDIALLKGCEHEYCVFCILKWALLKGAGANPPWCPQCKAPFSYLYVHRQLDGEVTDAPMEESVCLLKCATWFTEHLREADKGKLLSAHDADDDEETLIDDDLYDYDDMLDGAPGGRGHGRVVLGNRRLGEGGYMRSGRVFARPLPPMPTSSRKGRNKAAGPGSQQRPVPASGGVGGSSSNARVDASSSGAGGGSGSGAGSATAAGGAATAGAAAAAAAVAAAAAAATAGAAAVAAEGRPEGGGSALQGEGEGAAAGTASPGVGSGAGSRGGRRQELLQQQQQQQQQSHPKQPQVGRRAKRNARRAAYDLDDDYY